MAKPIRISGDVDLEKLLKRLSNDIVEAPAMLRLHKTLWEKFGEYQREVNQSGFFWSFAATGILEGGLLRIARIYDQEKSALSLQTLLLTIQANPHLFDDSAVRKRVNPQYAEIMIPGNHLPAPETIQQDLILVSHRDPLVKKIVVWRNNLGAHVSPKRILNVPSPDEEGVTREEAFMLCTRAFEIFNRYTQLFHATTTSTLIMGEDGSAHYVFKYLRMGLEAYDRQFEK